MNPGSRSLPLQTIFALILFSVLYCLIRAPFAHLVLPYYDDGETLYHALSLLSGQVPYRDDYNHHFIGYLLPYVLGAKLWGFSLDLVNELWALNQIFTALLIFLTLRLLLPFSPALLGALYCLLAKEPWVLSFFVQYELNLLIALILFFCVVALKYGSKLSLCAASLVCGLAFTYDQRALLLSLIPAAAILGQERPARLKTGTVAVLCFLLPPVLLAAYLAINGAWIPFIEQCFIFPARYRSGGQSLWEQLATGLMAQRHIVIGAPFLCLCALAGILFVATKRPELAAQAKVNKLFLAALLPCFLMPLLGARDFEYYSITWVPLLALFAGFSFHLVLLKFAAKKYLVASLLALPLLFSALEAVQLYRDSDFMAYRGDGASEVAAFLKANMEPQDTLYVWGYRLELYARLNKLAANPFASQLMVKPDGILPQELRAKQIYPKYRQEFEKYLSVKPPIWIVTFDRANMPRAEGLTEEFMRQVLAKSYTLEYQLSKTDFIGIGSIFKVYKRKTGT